MQCSLRPPHYTYQILERVPVFGGLAFDASAHHERILAAADPLDALSAERPYRGKLPTERVMAILREERGKGLSPDCVDAAERVLDTGIG